MAKPTPATTDDRGRKGLIIATTLMICLGLGAGATFARIFAVNPETAATRTDQIASGSAVPTPKRPNGRHGTGSEQAGEHGARDASAEHIVPLEPIITNMAGASKTWVRFEGLVVLSERPKDDRSALTAQISQDLMGLLRSTSLRQLETAAGLEFLREDMAELARLRSKGRARDILIKVLVVE